MIYIIAALPLLKNIETICLTGRWDRVLWYVIMCFAFRLIWAFFIDVKPVAICQLRNPRTSTPCEQTLAFICPITLAFLYNTMQY